MDTLELEARFPRLSQWESREVEPTLKQLEDYARATHAPIGYLFLPTPPDEPLPIPDFRTMAGRLVTRPSPKPARHNLYLSGTAFLVSRICAGDRPASVVFRGLRDDRNCTCKGCRTDARNARI